MTVTSPHRRTGGRSAAVLNAVREAVEELVRERGSERVTIPMVAERAGVNPTSIYRRWGDAPTMINDLATRRLSPDRPLPDTGDLRTDLTQWAREIVVHFRDPGAAALLRGGAAAAGTDESDCLRHRRAEATVLIERAPMSITVDEVLDVVIAPIVYRVLFQPATLVDELAPNLVDRLFRQH
ncbi:TetR/AcrR family transcriptional regulator [Catellatospora tritici]|uniref:TetR/AcrR family transcriptional regulator n=1 Tax=Catellatospora tritici TaxID=2851566 RepID=UPI001C2D8595|nr:TetR/AcrR family transcriptional regulator [Catellatospora tritici]MBV1853569.1 TetR/AcrR family transcriptional regulator [Catellatospora tritici]